MIRRTESAFAAASGRQLFRRSWLPDRTDRAFVVVHGFAEHSGRYDAMGAWFAERGCAVHAYDQQGHGESPGRRGHAVSFDSLVDDLEALVALTKEARPEVPLCVIGHSMGGLVVASYARERKPDQAGASLLVTSGAALALSPSLSRVKLVGARLLGRIAPRLSMDAGLPLDGLSRDPEVQRRYVEDPLVFTQMTAAMGAGMIAAIQRIQEPGGERVSLPMLMLHGEQDTLCPVEGSRLFFDAFTAEGSDIRTYPELRHEIFNEPEQEAVFTDLLDWVLAREAAGP